MMVRGPNFVVIMLRRHSCLLGTESALQVRPQNLGPEMRTFYYERLARLSDCSMWFEIAGSPKTSISASATASLWELSLPARALVDSRGATGEERAFRRGSFPESDSCKTTFRPARNLQ